MPDPSTALRSTDPADYQALPRRVAAMAKSFPSGFEIPPHDHERDQLLYAISGVMRVRTDTEAWIVPPDRAVYLPARTRHSVGIHGDLEMRTLYISDGPTVGLPRTATVLEVSDLLRALVLALINEPVVYDEDGRGGSIAELIINEISRAKELSYVVPMPDDVRLRRVCDALLADPSAPLTLDGWSSAAGASRRTLARLFDQELKMSFSTWRQRVRFHNALQALARGQPIKRVASQNGYRSASAFASAFRKAMGMSPSSIRYDRAK